MPAEPEALGLLALMLLHDSRRATQVTGAGDPIPLDEQDRSRWDRNLIDEGCHQLGRALRFGRPGMYQLQAAIAAEHARAVSSARTDWPRVVALYDELLAMNPSPVVALNHAVAVAMADGPAAGLALVEMIDELDRFHLLHAARADLLRRLGRVAEAVSAYRQAYELATEPADRRLLLRRINSLTGSDP
jgi:RNA polymerase sigma-70 factor (ECF subfamily)